MIRIASAIGFALIALTCATTAARAQETPAPVQPAATTAPTRMDMLYDGKPHLTLTPYIWGPTVNGVFQYTVPPLQRRGPRVGAGGTFSTSIQVGPSQYVPKINTAGMLDVSYQQGRFNFDGDAVYLNASTTATIQGSVVGPHGEVQIPITINSSARMATSIWQVAAGYALAQGHQADLIMFAGIREFPINVTADYNTVVGNRRFAGPSGTIDASDNTSDAIWGIRGKVFFGNDHWVVPYYFDVGQGTNNQSWQSFGGAGYVFNHGQSILALWRTLNYNAFPPVSHTQKLTLYGPIIGYSF
jgi:hypothetical protein